MPSSTKTDILGGQEAGTEAWQHFNSKQKGVLAELCLPYSVQPSASSPPPQADLSGPHSTLSGATHHGPQGPSIRGGASQSLVITVSFCFPEQRDICCFRTWDSQPDPAERGRHSPRRALERVRARLSSFSKLICKQKQL